MKKNIQNTFFAWIVLSCCLIIFCNVKAVTNVLTYGSTIALKNVKQNAYLTAFGRTYDSISLGPVGTYAMSAHSVLPSDGSATWVIEGRDAGKLAVSGRIINLRATFTNGSEQFQLYLASKSGSISPVLNYGGVFGQATYDSNCDWVITYGSGSSEGLLYLSHVNTGWSLRVTSRMFSLAYYDGSRHNMPEIAVYSPLSADDWWGAEIKSAATPTETLQQVFEEKVYTVVSSLSLSLFAEQVSIMQGLLDESKTMYVSNTQPGTDMQHNYYQGLNSMFSLCNKQDQYQLNLLKQLLMNIQSSNVLSDAQKNDLQNWIAQIEVYLKSIADASKTSAVQPITPTTTVKKQNTTSSIASYTPRQQISQPEQQIFNTTAQLTPQTIASPTALPVLPSQEVIQAAVSKKKKKKIKKQKTTNTKNKITKKSK